MNDEDIQTVLAKRHHNGGDFWATEDGRVYVGSPFSTLSSLGILHELGLPSTHEAVVGGVELIFRAWRDDGQIRLGPNAPLYPCYTAEAASSESSLRTRAWRRSQGHKPEHILLTSDLLRRAQASARMPGCLSMPG